MVIKVLDSEILSDEKIDMLKNSGYIFVTFNESKINMYKRLGFEHVEYMLPSNLEGSDIIED